MLRIIPFLFFFLFFFKRKHMNRTPVKGSKVQAHNYDQGVYSHLAAHYKMVSLDLTFKFVS